MHKKTVELTTILRKWLAHTVYETKGFVMLTNG